MMSEENQHLDDLDSEFEKDEEFEGRVIYDDEEIFKDTHVILGEKIIGLSQEIEKASIKDEKNPFTKLTNLKRARKVNAKIIVEEHGVDADFTTDDNIIISMFKTARGSINFVIDFIMAIPRKLGFKKRVYTFPLREARETIKAINALQGYVNGFLEESMFPKFWLHLEANKLLNSLRGYPSVMVFDDVHGFASKCNTWGEWWKDSGLTVDDFIDILRDSQERLEKLRFEEDKKLRGKS